MEFNEKQLALFKYLCHERYKVLLRRREGLSRPWTEDKLLRDYHFCNVFRRDDKTSVVIQTLINEQETYNDKVRCAILCRLTNRAETIRAIWEDPSLLLGSEVKINTAAYRLNTPKGINNRAGVYDLAMQERPVLAACLFSANGLQEAHKVMCGEKYLGGFTGYQILLDLLDVGFWRTKIMFDADWAYVGPGAARGMAALMGREVEYRFAKSAFRMEGDKTLTQQDLLRKICTSIDWPEAWPTFTVHEAEWMLCEFDKYVRKSRPGAARGRRFR